MQKNKGFTLIELMVTIAVLAIIATMAAPSFNRLILSQKLNSNTRTLVGAFNLAKSQASVMKRTVAVCPRKIVTTEDDAKKDCATAAIAGYAAMTDLEKTDVRENRVILMVIDPKVTLQSGSATQIVFSEVGSSGAQQSMSLCAGKELRTITILQLGNVTQTTGTC
ncbi:pilus assembly FimT family protein [Acinetobacter sp. ANC 4648]|uniref:pilus assembly FimT family protein n=1 Tax=Acinetobacter sp. ANC 4648 TaxID=1977875 RepID=UPI000A32B443|nr:GspH/FimT family pseudopilin [Acinetobacter sp. ANC 4648]OTG80692.1 type II secretion system protein GspH [Acinetobacter sp. ANC 4648]